MSDLTIVKQNGGAYIDSREVAEVIDKQHKNLLRDIRGYLTIIEGKRGQLNFEPSDFFVESTFVNEQNKEMPCYLISKMGCEMVANKLTGEKGVLFTAAYVAKFNEMETTEKAKFYILNTSKLGEFNATARIVVNAMKSAGANPQHIIDFLRIFYEPIGISIDICTTANVPLMYTAKEIAEICDVYSLNGNPHAQAVACILNDHIMLDDCYKTVVPVRYNNHVVTSVKYDSCVIKKVNGWLAELGFPNEIFGDNRTFHIYYLWDLA